MSRDADLVASADRWWQIQLKGIALGFKCGQSGIRIFKASEVTPVVSYSTVDKLHGSRVDRVLIFRSGMIVRAIAVGQRHVEFNHVG